MKKYLALISALAISLTMFTSCGDSKDEDNENKNSKTTSVSAADSEAANEEESSEPTLSDEERAEKFKEFNSSAYNIGDTINHSLSEYEFYGFERENILPGDFFISSDDEIVDISEREKNNDLNSANAEDVELVFKNIVLNELDVTKKSNVRIIIAGDKDNITSTGYYVFYSEEKTPVVGVDFLGVNDDNEKKQIEKTLYDDITDINDDKLITTIESFDKKVILTDEEKEDLKIQVESEKEITNYDNILDEMQHGAEYGGNKFTDTISKYKKKLSAGDYKVTYTKDDKPYDLNVLSKTKNQSSETILKYAGGAFIQSLGGNWCLGVDKKGNDSGRDSYTFRFIVTKNKHLYIAVTSSLAPQAISLIGYDTDPTIDDETTEKIKALRSIDDESIVDIVNKLDSSK